MPETAERLTAEYHAILPPDEALAVDARRVVARAIGTGEYEKLDITASDSDELKAVVRGRVEKLEKRNPKDHILFKGLPQEALLNPLSEEALHWDIECDKQLNPDAAKAILDLYKKLENLPPDVHKRVLKFPLFMVGYIAGHATRVAIYNTLMAQAINKDGLDYKINPVLAAVAGFLHDLGKLEAGQKQLIKKPGEFTRSDFQQVKEHPIHGAFAIRELGKHEDGKHFPADKEFYDAIWDAAMHHHVRPDRDYERSYPDWIPPSEITPLDKLTSLTDSFDAMTTRSYRYDHNPLVRRHDIESCFTDIERCKNVQFDPALAELFCKLRPIPKVF